MTLHYDFPLIKTIEDVLPAIKNRDEFIVAKKDGYIVINYVVNYEDTFPPVKTVEDAIRRECRGLIFDPSGNLISRRYHKFFNLNEKEDLQFDNIDLNESHNLLIKEDGSMISFARINGKIRALTKMGITDVSLQVDDWIKDKKNYLLFIEESIMLNLTPIFEWCSPFNQVIIKHNTSDLILTAIRDIFTGKYYDYTTLIEIADLYNINQAAKQYKGNLGSDIKEISKIISNEKNIEGIVVRFDDGHMIKIKTLDYVSMSRARDSIVREKNVIEFIINDKIDDIIPFMVEQDRERVIKFKDEFLRNKKLVTDQLILDVKSAINEYESRKEFGLNCSNNVLRHFAFSSWDDPTTLVGKTVDNLIKENISTQTRVDSIRWLWNGIKWEFDWN